MIYGLKSAIEARENKTHNPIKLSRLDNARSHLNNAIEELKKGFKSIEQFDDGV